MSKDNLVIEWLRTHVDAYIPSKAFPTDACMDMKVIVGVIQDVDRPVGALVVEQFHDPDGIGKPVNGVHIYPNQSMIFHTGLKCAIPEGYVLKVYVRSSTGIKKHLTLCNGTGIIDSHYRGEIMVALKNDGSVPQQVCNGDKIVQCALEPVLDYSNKEVFYLGSTDRGEGGIGSTGK